MGKTIMNYPTNNMYFCVLLFLFLYINGIKSKSLYAQTTNNHIGVLRDNPTVEYGGVNIIPNESLPPPNIDKVDITSNIQYRYAKTVVKVYVKNPSMSAAQEVKFQMVLPVTAFISNFTIQIKGEEDVYVADVVEKEEAKASYNEAISRGQSAGLVEADTRDVTQITVKSNLKAASKMEFTLTYEELLKRHVNKYEHIIHIHPGQIVENYDVNIYINESLPIAYINVPELKTSENEITSLLEKNQIAEIRESVGNDPRKAHIKFSPSIEEQQQMARAAAENDGEDISKGMGGQFIVQYDVDRKNQGNDIQVLDGYFVHFFAPDHLQALPKHVVFVLDVSGSMYGTKLVQLKDAMMTILDDLSEQDYFNILTFSTRVQHWNPNQKQFNQRDPVFSYMDTTPSYVDGVTEEEKKVPLTYRGKQSILKKVRKHVLNLNDGGGTNINDAFLEALNVVTNVRASESIPSNIKPMIIFLTDGEATQGITINSQILKNMKEANQGVKIPIYGLAFGSGADFNLIKSIGTDSGAFSRRIYEASDAAIQLEDFYAEISSPLLTNVKFEYVGGNFRNTTISKLNTFFRGSEYIVAGKLDVDNGQGDDLYEELEIVVLAEGNSSKYDEKIKSCGPIAMPRLPLVSVLPDYDLEYDVIGNSSKKQ